MEDVELQCIKEKVQVVQGKDQIAICAKNIAMKEQSKKISEKTMVVDHIE